MSYAPQRDPDSAHPMCAGCTDDDVPAEAVIVHADGHPVPYCGECSDEHVYKGGLEFPVGEFYHLLDAPETVTRVPGSRSAEICESAGDGGNPSAWISATNPADGQKGFVRLSDWQ